MKYNETDNSVNEIMRLEWACRRGMLELDVLLGNFLREAYHELSINDKSLFKQLLQQSDPELFAWLMGHQTPPSQALIHVVDKVRHHARTRVHPKAF